MADNVPITPGAGAPIATDDIAGSHYQRIKMIHGIDGVSDGDVAKTNPLPTRMGVGLTRDFLMAFISVSASGFNVVVAADAAKSIKVLGWAFKVGGAVSVKLRNEGTGATDLTPSMPYANNGDGWVQDIIGQPYMVTAVGGNFGLTLSAAVPVTGIVFFTQE
jgi:hypothetical protein